MRKRMLSTVIATGVIASLVAPAYVAAATVPTCFGKRATIVGTNRDPLKPVELKGTAKNDVIVGLRGVDIIDGRGGNDLVCAGGGDDLIQSGAGNDKVKGQDDLDSIHGGRGRDRIWGGEGGGSSLQGGPGRDRLFGGPGTQDSLIGGPGDDVMNGGAGYDLAEFWESPRRIEADLTTDLATGHGEDRILSLEGLVGSNFDDLLIGDDLSNMIQGGGGNDVVRALGSDGDGGSDILGGADGDDLLDGGEGPDIASFTTPWAVNVDLSAGTATTDGFGNDTLVGIEHLVGSRENDTLVGDAGDNLIIGNAGDDSMDGREGVDEVAFFDARQSVVADLGAGTADAGAWGADEFANFENLSGSVWQDVLVGDDGPNFIWGGNRSDSLAGVGGDDILIGARGNDNADGGLGTDGCEAEIQNNCEVDPSPGPALGPSIWELMPLERTW